MPSFSDLVWSIPLLYFLTFVIGLTVGKNKQQGVMISTYIISSIAFILGCGMLWERIFLPSDDYSFNINWLIIGDSLYQIGYELNNSSAWLIMLITSLNVLLLLLKQKQGHFLHYGYISLMFGSMSGVVLADHMFTFFIFAVLASCAVYLLLAHPVHGSNSKVIFRFMTAQTLGFSLFFIALIGLYWYMPDYSLQFTMLETVFSSSTPDFTPFMKVVIAAALVLSALLIAGVLPYANWMKHMEADRPLLRVATFCMINLLLPVYILLRFHMVIGASYDVMWLCKLAGAIMVIAYTLRMLLNAQHTLVYIGLMLLGSIVFAYGQGAFGYVLLQLTIISLSLVIVYRAAIQASSIMVYGSFLIAILTLIGVPPLGGYWMQQSLVATIAKQGLGWYAVSLLIVLCCALGVTIYFASQWKSGMKHAGKEKLSVVIIPAIVLVGLGLLWLINHTAIEKWLFDTAISESMQLMPMVLTMLSVVIGVAVAWLFSERVTEAFASSLERADVQLRQRAEQLGRTLVSLGGSVVKTEQIVERGIEQLLTLWLPYPLRIVSRIGANRNVWYSIALVITLTVVITALWYGIRGR